MIIDELKKNKDDTYTVRIDQKEYVLTEESILKYRLFKGYEISKEALLECISSDDLAKIKKRAYAYSLKYLKNSYEILNYLTDRDIPYPLAKDAIDELIAEGKINDLPLAKSLASSLARSSNGKYMISYKLKNRHFSDEIITEALSSISEEDIIEGKEKLKKACQKRYKNLSDYEQSKKTRDVFYRHGYESF